MIHFKHFHDNHPNVVITIMIVLAVTFLLMFGALMQGCDYPPTVQLTASPAPTPTPDATPTPTENAPKEVAPAPKDIRVIDVRARGEVDVQADVLVFNQPLTLSLNGTGQGGSKAMCLEVTVVFAFVRITQNYPEGCQR